MHTILLLDYDKTLYPSTLPTLKAVDERITLYMCTFLGLSPAEADATRRRFGAQYGTTLKGLEAHHGVDRDHYCDFIHAVAEQHLPPPDPQLTAWFNRLAHPCYLFTNAHRDWAIRGLQAMGLAALLPGEGETARRHASPPAPATRLAGIFDIAFMDWQGKPHPAPYAKVEAFLRQRHGPHIAIHFADDRPENLATARQQQWSTIWIAPHDIPEWPPGPYDRVVSALTSLDPALLA
jgi:pyrimidine 5'-nucleotidase